MRSILVTKWGQIVVSITAGFIGVLVSLLADYFFTGQWQSLQKVAPVFLILSIVYLISTSILKQVSFPNKVKGFLPYNTSIKSSHFQVQNIIGEYKKELFLIGANQNFILNLENSKDQFLKLVESLGLNKKVLILISDPEDRSLMDVYDVVSSKDDFRKEEAAVVDSIQKIDKTIADFYGNEKLEEIKKKKLLEIRCTKAFLETFCFVDAGSRKGKGYFIIIGKRIAGGSRPIFYFTEDDDNEIFATYYERYKVEFEQARLLWPS